MNRFECVETLLLPNEVYIRRDFSVRIYDGETKTNFSAGELMMTSHRFIWGRPGDIPSGKICLSLDLRYVVFFEEETPGAFSFGRSSKVVVHLSEPHIYKLPGPVDSSTNMYIKFSFKDGLDSKFIPQLADNIMKKRWEIAPILPPISQSNQSTSSTAPQLPIIKTRTGIIGIERSLQERQKATDQSISTAFQDLHKLMRMASHMVAISETISTKIREKQGDITEDETIKYKSYLMSLGIDDPVTRDLCKSNNEYFKQLAMEAVTILEEPIRGVGGMMVLTEAYCRVNRARGLDLLSPEDFLNGCKQLAPLGLPLILRVFDSGVMVLQSRSHDDNVVVEDIAELLEAKGSITAEKMAQSEGISVLLAREKLLVTEKYGRACRDDTIEALTFYPNLFLEGGILVVGSPNTH